MTLEEINNLPVGTIFEDCYNGFSAFYMLVDHTKKGVYLTKLIWDTVPNPDDDPVHRTAKLRFENGTFVKEGEPVLKMIKKYKDSYYIPGFWSNHMYIVEDPFATFSMYWG